jgi:hypothetical protein
VPYYISIFEDRANLIFTYLLDIAFAKKCQSGRKSSPQLRIAANISKYLLWFGKRIYKSGRENGTY